jgi:hypothetical protein
MEKISDRKVNFLSLLVYELTVKIMLLKKYRRNERTWKKT